MWIISSSFWNRFFKNHSESIIVPILINFQTLNWIFIAFQIFQQDLRLSKSIFYEKVSLIQVSVSVSRYISGKSIYICILIQNFKEYLYLYLDTFLKVSCPCLLGQFLSRIAWHFLSYSMNPYFGVIFLKDWHAFFDPYCMKKIARQLQTNIVPKLFNIWSSGLKVIRVSNVPTLPEFTVLSYYDIYHYSIIPASIPPNMTKSAPALNSFGNVFRTSASPIR